MAGLKTAAWRTFRTRSTLPHAVKNTRMTVQGPVKKPQMDYVSHRGMSGTSEQLGMMPRKPDSRNGPHQLSILLGPTPSLLRGNRLFQGRLASAPRLSRAQHRRLFVGLCWPRRSCRQGGEASRLSECVRVYAPAYPPPPQGSIGMAVHHRRTGAPPLPPGPPPPPLQTKVTIVGKNEIYNRENLVGYTNFWVPDPHPFPPLLIFRCPPPPLTHTDTPGIYPQPEVATAPQASSVDLPGTAMSSAQLYPVCPSPLPCQVAGPGLGVTRAQRDAQQRFRCTQAWAS